MLDGEGEPVPDAMVEVWQADVEGRYRPDFGWGRSGCDAEGRYSFVTRKPGRVTDGNGGLQAPHLSLLVFARGLLKPVRTRLYFPGEETNADDRVLAAVPERRALDPRRASARQAGWSSTSVSRATSRRRSSRSEVFERLFVPAEFRDATSDTAWLHAMLDAESALAGAEAQAGVIPAAAAEAIAAACRAEVFDAAALFEAGRAAGQPGRAARPRAARRRRRRSQREYVHWGATSQDVVDTAAMLVAARALDLLLGVLDGVSDACASLADAHRSTPMAGRTLLQQAVPITFGLKAAGWLVSVRRGSRAPRQVLRPSGLRSSSAARPARSRRSATGARR